MKSKATKDELWGNQPTSSVYNAKSIAKNQIPGINRVVKLRIVIEGKSVKNFNHFSLKQSVYRHHSFHLELPYDALENFEDHKLEEAQNFLGKRLTVVIAYKDVDDSPERTFVGVITEII